MLLPLLRPKSNSEPELKFRDGGGALSGVATLNPLQLPGRNDDALLPARRRLRCCMVENGFLPESSRECSAELLAVEGHVSSPGANDQLSGLSDSPRGRIASPLSSALCLSGVQPRPRDLSRGERFSLSLLPLPLSLRLRRDGWRPSRWLLNPEDGTRWRTDPSIVR